MRVHHNPCVDLEAVVACLEGAAPCMAGGPGGFVCRALDHLARRGGVGAGEHELSVVGLGGVRVQGPGHHAEEDEQ